MSMLKRYPGLRNIAPEYRLEAFKQLLTQDRWRCYSIYPHTDRCWAEHRPIVPNRAGAYCDRHYIRSPYYGDEHWKIKYWRKAVTG